MKNKNISIHLSEMYDIQCFLKQKRASFCLNPNPSSNTLRNSDYKKEKAHLDLSSFSAYLDFNPEAKWIVVEPKVTFGSLCQFTLKRDLLPPVVPEFPNITVGGAVMGTALESSSHRYGQVSDHCLEYEIILGNGEIVRASPQENSDLFYGVSGSFGTLGILTAIKLKLISAKPYVHLKYHWHKEAKDALQQLMYPTTADYIEGIVYKPSDSVVIEGKMVDKAPSHLVYRQKSPWTNWFAGHVDTLPRPFFEEFMPLEEYLFRHDRGAFWIGRYVLSFPILLRLLLRWGIPTPYPYPLKPHLLLRLLFGWTFPSQRLYKIWHRIPNHISENLFFIHDFYIPIIHAQALLNRFIKTPAIFPIWMCPIQGTFTPQLLSPHYNQERFINFGLYGMPKHGDPKTLSSEIEREIASLGGRKMLYSYTYYDQKTFEDLYHGGWYRDLRKKYYADGAFPTLFQKVCRSPIS